MSKVKRTEKTIPVDRVFLQLENPRHEPYKTQSEVIGYLCRHEHVLPLANDIVEIGLNPLERFAVLRDLNSGKGKSASYLAGEGNRRHCAIKLLADPDLAPPDLRKKFEILAAKWDGIKTIPVVLFEDIEDLKLWRTRIHQGPQGGIGRKEWNPEQKQRDSGSNKNRIAQALLDYAQDQGFISADQRKGKLTTVQRYAGNPVFRETLGIDTTKPDEVRRNRDAGDFQLLVEHFISDILNRPEDVNSRSNAPEIRTYARRLGSLEGLSGKLTEPESLVVQSGSSQSRKRRKRPRKQVKASRLPTDTDVADKLRALGSFKLEHLYYSLGNIPLPENTQLLAVGLWSFFETLAAKAGGEHSFESFFSNQRLSQYGLGIGKNLRPYREALRRISAYGNTTKHHDTAGAFNGDQLANDLETLREVILNCVDEINSTPK